MNSRETILRLRVPNGKAVLGFDSFVDRIGRYPDAMRALGKRLCERDGLSFMVGMRDVHERLGGNTPNMACGLSAFGAQVTCVGAFGHVTPHPAFEELNRRCELLSFGNPAHCLAVEFEKGKLFFADQGDFERLTWRRITEQIGMDTLADCYREATMIGLFNWGELPAMQGIWEALEREILSGLPQRPTVLTDPSDMGERQDVPELLALLKRMRQNARVVMSVNQGEANKLCKTLSIRENDPETQTRALYAHGFCDLMVMHTEDAAFAASEQGVCGLPTHKASHPVLLTGGGDTFNAGLGLGLMLDFDPSGCLQTANAASAYYVRHGASPSIKELSDEIEACCELWQQ